MYENEKDEEYWMELAEEKGEELGVDTREGSVYMDTQSGHCIRTAKFYSDLEIIHESMMPDSATGEFLTQYAAIDSVTRRAATCSCWSANFVGTVPEEGTEFMCGGYYFTWKDVSGVMCLVSNDAGEYTNLISPGEDLIPVDNIDDLGSATLGELIVPGKAEETDEALRMRWRELKINPAANSNVPQIKMMCEELEGIGRAKIFPLWGGANTVKAVLFSTLGQNISEALVNDVQELIDPVEKGYVVEVDGNTYIFGDGLGEGMMNIGLHFLAASATPVNIVITANIELQSGYTQRQITEETTNKVITYLSKLALETPDKREVVVRISSIGSIIANVDGVLDYDYDSLCINGMGENITIDEESVAVLEEIVFTPISTKGE